MSKTGKVPPLPPASRFDVALAPPPPEEERKKTRSRSMIVKNTIQHPNAVGQLPGGPLIPFDPLAAFSVASESASSSFPRSELQLADTSTILHPSNIIQIIVDGSGNNSELQIKTRRSRTIAGDAKTIKVPSSYIEKLLKKRKEAFPDSHLAGPSLSTLVTHSSSSGPNPSTPKMSKSTQKSSPASSEEGEAERSESSEDDTTGGSEQSSTASSPDPVPLQGSASSSLSSFSSSSSSPGIGVEEVPFALQYDEGVIDFTDHPSDEQEEGEGKTGEEK